MIDFVKNGNVTKRRKSRIKAYFPGSGKKNSPNSKRQKIKPAEDPGIYIYMYIYIYIFDDA